MHDLATIIKRNAEAVEAAKPRRIVCIGTSSSWWAACNAVYPVHQRTPELIEALNAGLPYYAHIRYVLLWG